MSTDHQLAFFREPIRRPNNNIELAAKEKEALYCVRVRECVIEGRLASGTVCQINV